VGVHTALADRASYGVALEIIEAHAVPFVRRSLGATLGMNSHRAYLCVGAKLALSSPIFGRESWKGHLIGRANDRPRHTRTPR
jgi:hypothetical protein